MSEINARQVKELREKTGAGMMDCKKALAESGGEFEKAIDALRKKGLKSVEKRAEKVAAEGIIFSYIHPGSRVGVLLELNCETDFVARSADFGTLAKDIAMHVAWAAPKYVSRDEVSQDLLEREREIYLAQITPEQQTVADKILDGKIDKFYETVCLLEQMDAKDGSGKKRIRDLVSDLSAKVGEKVVLRRFSRFEVGEGIERSTSDFAQDVSQAAVV